MNPKTKTEEIDSLIRDITKAGFMPKSEARRRINQLLNQQAKDLDTKCKFSIRFLQTEIRKAVAKDIIGEIEKKTKAVKLPMVDKRSLLELLTTLKQKYESS